MKDCYKGRRGFIIGNGPSLRVSDLDRLREEVTIASNLIYLSYDQTDWRPTHVTCIDRLVWEKVAQIAHIYYPMIITSDNLDTTTADCLTVQFRVLGHAPFCDQQPAFSSDMAKGSYGGSSVTYDNLQLAYHFGLNPVYLLGCDHYYQGEKNIQEHKPVEHQVQNHFHPDYRRAGEQVNPAPIENMTRSFEIASEFAKTSNFNIYNSTRGGHLEVFDRVDFDTLFSPKPLKSI